LAFHSLDVDLLYHPEKFQVYPLSEVMEAYFVSFILTGNPNSHKLDTAPPWPLYENSSDYLLTFDFPLSNMKVKDDRDIEEKCVFWEGVRSNKKR
jgi:carboxylesterase type B